MATACIVSGCDIYFNAKEGVAGHGPVAMFG